MEEYSRLPEGMSPLPRRPYGTGRLQFAILIGLLAGVVLLAVIPYVAEQVNYGLTRGRARAEAEAAREELAGLPDAVNRFRLAVKAVEPSVVGIETVRMGGGPTLDDEWSSFVTPGPRLGMGQGSGVLVDPAGYIVTNFHVVNGVSVVQGVPQITVRLSDGRAIHDTEIVGTDPASDLAVLRIKAQGLIAASWGDSDKLEVGDQVLAVGSPYRLAQTVTAGIISAKDRRGILRDLDLQDFLQTDAAINPGNSGGPLVNLRGEVVGINTAIVGEAYRGIGFAIPSRIAQDVYTRLKAGETVPRGWLGVAMQDLDDRLAEQLKLAEARGVLVTDVVAGSPADKAGLQPGDVITQWKSKRVTDSNDLRFLVAGTRAGSSATVTFFRNGEQREASVTVGQRPPQIRR